MSEKTHGGKRAGAGRPITGKAKKPWGVTMNPEDLETVRAVPNQNQAAALFASGLRLGKGNVGQLDANELGIIMHALQGTVLDALTIRHLADEVAELVEEYPNHAPALAEKMRAWGDWELLYAAMLCSAPGWQPGQPGQPGNWS